MNNLSSDYVVAYAFSDRRSLSARSISPSTAVTSTPVDPSSSPEMAFHDPVEQQEDLEAYDCFSLPDSRPRSAITALFSRRVSTAFLFTALVDALDGGKASFASQDAILSVQPVDTVDGTRVAQKNGKPKHKHTSASCSRSRSRSSELSNQREPSSEIETLKEILLVMHETQANMSKRILLLEETVQRQKQELQRALALIVATRDDKERIRREREMK